MWFPDKRGLAAGLTAAGFGAGSALTVLPIIDMIKNSGYEQTFLTFGIGQGVVILILSFLLSKPTPPKGVVPKPRIVTTKVDYTLFGMAKTPVFWVIYVLFVAVAMGGLMATAQIGPIAKAFGIDKMPMSFLGLATVPLLAFVGIVDQLANGFTRPLCGFISDRIGRENTMLLVFGGEGVALLAMMEFGKEPLGFMICAPLIFLFWGEIFSIFPAICADTFGNKNAAGNAGLLYTAKGTASFFVTISSIIAATKGNWDQVFLIAACSAIVAGLFAKFVLAPMRARTIERANAAAG
jgi:OFA family oxalate/formate antiporter-like MFS transporter